MDTMTQRNIKILILYKVMKKTEVLDKITLYDTSIIKTWSKKKKLFNKIFACDFTN